MLSKLVKLEENFDFGGRAWHVCQNLDGSTPAHPVGLTVEFMALVMLTPTSESPRYTHWFVLFRSAKRQV